jgi:hypothetical protein
LISSDNAFYESYDHKKGLATKLAAEVTAAKQKITLLPKLSDLLVQVKIKIELDMELLAQKVIEDTGDRIAPLLTENGFIIGDVAKIERRLYATETPQLLFLEFTADYNCPATSEIERAPGTLTISGNGTYNIDTKEIGRLRSSGEVLRFRLGDGTETEHRNVYASADIYLGHREIRNKIRYELD